MPSVSRLRRRTTSLVGEGLMQSPEEWSRRNDVLSRTLTQLVAEHRSPNARKALDVGAQNGALMDRYAELTGLEWVGIDPVFDVEHRSPGDRLLLPGTADELPFDDGEFDVVMFANVFEHILPGQRLSSLRELARVLKAGGIIVGQIPNPYFVIENHSRLPLMGYLPLRLQHQYWRLSRVPWDHDFFVVTPRHLRNAAAAAGFEPQVVRRFNYPVEVLPARVRPLARLIDRPTRRIMPWAWQFVFTRAGD